MNSYVLLLIMRELFCLNALWKVKALMKRSFWWKEVFDEKKSCSLKIKISKVLLCFKGKASDESTSLCLKVIRYLFLWNVKFYDYESYNILREEVYEEKFCYSLRRF